MTLGLIRAAHIAMECALAGDSLVVPSGFSRKTGKAPTPRSGRSNVARLADEFEMWVTRAKAQRDNTLPDLPKFEHARKIKLQVESVLQWAPCLKKILPLIPHGLATPSTLQEAWAQALRNHLDLVQFDIAVHSRMLGSRMSNMMSPRRWVNMDPSRHEAALRNLCGDAWTVLQELLQCIDLDRFLGSNVETPTKKSRKQGMHDDIASTPQSSKPDS